MISAGKFTAEVSGPHPCWIKVSYGGQVWGTIHHSELRDLQFAIDRAMADAERKLGTNDKDELR